MKTLPLAPLATLATAALLVIAGCSPYQVRINKTEGLMLPNARSFRVNYDVHDDQGKSITDEIMRSEIERWYQFTEMAHRARYAFEDLDYRFVYDPGVPADFVVDVGFSAFYSEKITEEQLWSQRPATLLVGRKNPDGTYTHVVVLSVLAKNPRVTSDELVVVWEGRGTLTDENPDARLAGYPIMVELLKSYPLAPLPAPSR
ncbi:hypothetical protein GX586_12845 [bacterium]|nr:hypothetical protein [bacterium]